MIQWAHCIASILFVKNSESQKIIIQGINAQGKAFRPSDWAERVSGTLATFKNCRINYSPMLQPTVHQNGYKCILLDPKLKELSPHIYQSILNFANENNLTICNQEEAS